MLTRCPECEQKVSIKAADCPHCGYPLKSKMGCLSKSLLLALALVASFLGVTYWMMHFASAEVVGMLF